MDLDARAAEAAASLRNQVEPALDVEGARHHVARGSVRRQSRHLALVGGSLAAACVALVVGLAAVSLGGNGRDADSWIMDPERSAADQAIVDGLPRSPIDGRSSWRLPVLAQPQSGINDGDTVTVYGRGFDAHDSLGVVMCTSEAESEGVAACDLGDDEYEFAHVDYASADGEGTVVARVRVRQHISTPVTGPVDCASGPERCLIAIGAVSNYDRSGGSYIDFAGAPPFPEPSFSVAPDGPYTPGQEVITAAEGLMPGRLVQVEQCLSQEPCVPLARGFSAEDGTFVAGVTVNSVLYVDGEALECAERCSLRLNGVGVEGQSSAPLPSAVPLAFDGGPPLPEDQVPPPTTDVPAEAPPEVVPVDPVEPTEPVEPGEVPASTPSSVPGDEAEPGEVPTTVTATTAPG